MKREEAIEILECIYMEVSTDEDKEAVDMAIEALKAQRPHGEWIKEPIYLCHYGCDGCYKDKKYADLEWCSTCEFWKADDFRYVCSNCNNKEEYQPRFCPKCGSDNRKREWWIFTFGCGQQHAGKYVKIWGTFSEARTKMVNKYGTEWGFQYSEKEWENWKKDENRGWVMETELEVIGEEGGDGE